MLKRKNKTFDAEKYSVYCRDKLSADQIAAEYKKIKNLPEDAENRQKKAVLETILYELGMRSELPEKFAWELLQGAKLFCQVAGAMPNKRFRKVLVRAELFGAEIKIVGYAQIRSPYADRYKEGSFMYARI
ncbi:MAG: hypothetical protein J6P03_08725 [Opitutales bacterium]|nr:hypothetical protein [Opitutales bacterium]